MPDTELVKILPLYERIARASGDDAVLFDYLERRVATPDVSPREVREAIDLAVALNREERMEPLLVRLADVAAERGDGREDATWALFELLRIKKAAGDLDAAAHILQRASELLPLDRVVPLARDLAERAGRSGNRRLGAELLERLRTTAPADESLWQPLVDHYVSLRDRDGLGRLVEETLPLLPEVAPRNQLRMALARLRLSEDAGDGAAAAILQDVLLEEAGHAEALGLLAEHYERSGSEGDLVDLLTQAFDAAIAARAPDGVVAAALRLGGVLERKDAERAAETYERALAVAPRRGELVKRVLALRPTDTATREHAELIESLLDAETGAEAAASGARARGGLDRARRRRGGAARAREGLRAGARRDDVLRRARTPRIAASRTGPRCANLQATEAARREDAVESAALYVEAASLRRGRLADVNGGLELLRRARTRAPHDIQIVEQLARALVANGELGAAVAEVRAALADERLAPEQRLPLQLLRAKLEAARGDHRAAVTVLEEALDVVAGDGDTGAGGGARIVASRRARAMPPRISGRRRFASRSSPAAPATSRWRGGCCGELRRARRGRRRDGAPDLGAGGGRGRRGQRVLGGPALHERRRRRREDRSGAPARRARRTDQPGARRRGGHRGRARGARAAELALIDLLAPLYEQTGQLGKLAGLLLDQGNSNADEEQRFEQLRRAGAFAIQAQDPSLAIMALNEAMRLRPGDEETTLLLSDAYVLAGALEEAAGLLAPPITARKGKPLTGPGGALHPAGPHPRARRRSQRPADRARPCAGRRQEERRPDRRGRGPRRGGRRRRARAARRCA